MVSVKEEEDPAAAFDWVDSIEGEDCPVFEESS